MLVLIFFFLIFCFFVGGGDEIISGLSFVGIICEDALFLNGLAVHQIWSQVFFFLFLFFLTIFKCIVNFLSSQKVNDAGEGPISNPITFPVKQNRLLFYL